MQGFIEKSEGDNRSYVKLKDKESLRGVFRGAPHDFKIHWLNNRSHPCTGRPDCPHCMAGDKPKFRFNLNFVTKENDQYVVKVFEQGWTVYEQLREINKDYPLEHTLVKITRNGSGTDTTYTILPLPNGTLTADQEAVISKLPLADLSAGPDSSPQPMPSDAMAGQPEAFVDDLPF